MDTVLLGLLRHLKALHAIGGQRIIQFSAFLMLSESNHCRKQDQQHQQSHRQKSVSSYRAKSNARYSSR